MRPKPRQVDFTPAEMDRLRTACQALGVTYGEFVHFAVLEALSELEGYARAERQNGACPPRRQPGPTWPERNGSPVCSATPPSAPSRGAEPSSRRGVG